MLKLAMAAVALGLAGPVMAQGMYGQATNPHAVQNPYANQYGTGSNLQSQGVQEYTNHNGTYVQPYERTMPNSTQTDNYGTRGNVNPYNGAYGTRTPR